MRLFIRWILYSLAFIFIAWLIPGISINSPVTALFAVVLFGLINAFIKPILLIITLPINFLTLGLFTLFINGFMLQLAGVFAPGFNVDGFWSAFLGAIVLSLLGGFINAIEID